MLGKGININDMICYSSLIPRTIYVCVTILILSVEAVSEAASLQSEAKVKLYLKLQSKTVHSTNQFKMKIIQKQGAEVERGTADETGEKLERTEPEPEPEPQPSCLKKLVLDFLSSALGCAHGVWHCQIKRPMKAQGAKVARERAEGTATWINKHTNAHTLTQFGA